MNAVLGYAQILKRQENLENKQIDYANTIYTSGKHLLSLINDILDLARIEAQRMKIESKPFNLPALISSVYGITKINAEERGLLVEFEELSPLPQTVVGDERKLRQVLLNLLANAIKYTEEGRVTFRVKAMNNGRPWRVNQGEKEKNNEQATNILQFQVEDTGIGIPQDKLEAIFQPFTKGDPEGGKSEGTGAGGLQSAVAFWSS